MSEACHSGSMTPASIDELSQKIERLVEEHLASTRAAVTAAIERAFNASIQARTVEPQIRVERPKEPAKASRDRRASADIAELAERLHQAVRANPGESMAILAVEVGATPRQLEYPMCLLKDAGRVRCTGTRIHARYFPTTVGLKPSA